MEVIDERRATIVALNSTWDLCDECRQQAAMQVIVLPRALALARAPCPVHHSAFGVPPDDDLSLATWEDAEWQ